MAMVEALADGPDRRRRLVPHPAGRGGEAPALRGGRERRRRPRDPAARRRCSSTTPATSTLPALWRALALNPARLLGLAAGRLAAGRPGRPRPLRPRHALRPRPRHAALEVEEHPLRPPPHAGPGARAPGSPAARSSRGSPHDPRPHLPPRLPARLDPLRRAHHPRPRPRRPARIGSGNIGATNVLRTGNKGAAAATLLLDAAKGAVAGAGRPRARRRGGRAWSRASPPSSATSSRSGSKFRGGKGVATFLGIMLALAWPAGLAACATWLAVAFATRYLLARRAGRRRRDPALALGLRPARRRLARHRAGRPRLRPPPRQHPPPARRHEPRIGKRRRSTASRDRVSPDLLAREISAVHFRADPRAVAGRARGRGSVAVVGS